MTAFEKAWSVIKDYSDAEMIAAEKRLLIRFLNLCLNALYHVGIVAKKHLKDVIRFF